mgnify:FL=1
MFVIFENGGKQYKVREKDIVKLEKMDCKKDQVIEINDILLLNNDKGETIIGSPYVKEVSVKAKVIDLIKDKKVLIFKKKRRHNYRRKLGHRQNVILLKIEEIKLKSSKQKITNEPLVKKESAKK